MVACLEYAHAFLAVKQTNQLLLLQNLDKLLHKLQWCFLSLQNNMQLWSITRPCKRDNSDIKLFFLFCISLCFWSVTYLYQYCRHIHGLELITNLLHISENFIIPEIKTTVKSIYRMKTELKSPNLWLVCKTSSHKTVIIQLGGFQLEMINTDLIQYVWMWPKFHS